jgi:hypothetical protein
VGSESEECVIVVGSRTPWPSLVGVFAAGLPCLMVLPLLRVVTKGWKVVAKVGTEAHKGVGSPWGPSLMWVSVAFHIFPCTWKLLPSWLP